MNKKTKNILAIAGVIAVVVGIVLAIPSFLKANYLVAILATILMIGGLVLLAVAFGD